MLLLLAACATDPASGDDTATPAVCEPVEDLPVEKYAGDPPRAARTLSGVVVTTLEFDAEAEALGFVDCSYTREWALLPEITDQGWLCPDCAWLTKGEGEVIEGYADCYGQISESDAIRVEHLGFAAGDDGLHLWRSGYENVPLADTGAAVNAAALDAGEPVEVAWSDEGELEDGGVVTLSAAGTLTAGTSDTLTVADPAQPRTEPYTCGWPLQSPGGPVESWVPTTGEVFPNVRLLDQCGEQVDLWDFRGRYVIIDAASPDCGPCNAMAATAEAFKAEMAARCIPVETITVLNESLSAVNKPADAATVRAWIEAYGITSPVLADEGVGYDLIAPYVSGGDGVSLPSALVIAPDGRLLGGDHGYSDDSGGWDRYAAFIFDDLGISAAE